MIAITFEDVPRLNSFVSEVERRFSDFRPFWNDFAVGWVSREVLEVFETEGYGTWAPLAPATAAAKATAFPGRGSLQRTGTYLGAASDIAHPGNVFAATPTEMVYGVDAAYFTAQAGAPYPERHERGLGVPERAVFGLISEAATVDTAISALLAQWSADEVAAAEGAFFG